MDLRAQLGREGSWKPVVSSGDLVESEGVTPGIAEKIERRIILEALQQKAAGVRGCALLLKVLSNGRVVVLFEPLRRPFIRRHRARFLYRFPDIFPLDRFKARLNSLRRR